MSDSRHAVSSSTIILGGFTVKKWGVLERRVGISSAWLGRPNIMFIDLFEKIGCFYRYLSIGFWPLVNFAIPLKKKSANSHDLNLFKWNFCTNYNLDLNADSNFAQLVCETPWQRWSFWNTSATAFRMLLLAPNFQPKEGYSAHSPSPLSKMLASQKNVWCVISALENENRFFFILLTQKCFQTFHKSICHFKSTTQSIGDKHFA
jgi:hypothetical protein